MTVLFLVVAASCIASALLSKTSPRSERVFFLNRVSSALENLELSGNFVSHGETLEISGNNFRTDREILFSLDLDYHFSKRYLLFQRKQ